jgi:hypothetical protein
MPLPAPETADEPAGDVTSAPPAGRLGASVEGLAGSFERAAETGGVLERSIWIGGVPVRLRLAGSYLAEQLNRAFEHVASDEDLEPELTIHAWDSGESGAPPPPLPALASDSPRGTTFYAAHDGLRLSCRPTLGQLSAYDSASSRAWFWCRDSHELPFWERAAPFRQVLHWWLPEHGMLLVHGAAVGNPSGGVLLVGAGGSGKSSSALSALSSDLLYAGDDYVAVRLAAEPWVVSLYCSGKLEPGHARLFPHLPAPSFEGDGAVEEKSVFYVAESFPERMCQGFPLRAIVAPRVVGAQPRLYPLPAAQALAALAPSTLLQLVPAGQEALSAMAGLLQQVPAFRLEVGGPIEELPGALQRLIQEVVG